MLPGNARLAVAGHVCERARTFSDRPPGTAFWYENSNGLVEIAVMPPNYYFDQIDWLTVYQRGKGWDW